jgi:hypothetical protein
MPALVSNAATQDRVIFVRIFCPQLFDVQRLQQISHKGARQRGTVSSDGTRLRSRTFLPERLAATANNPGFRRGWSMRWADPIEANRHASDVQRGVPLTQRGRQKQSLRDPETIWRIAAVGPAWRRASSAGTLPG